MTNAVIDAWTWILTAVFDAEDMYDDAKAIGDTIGAIRWAIILDTLNAEFDSVGGFDF